jgi:hypothetical protein
MAVIWKGFTVKQPYAQLLAIGAEYGKQYETRSKPTKYRGPVIIHAGKDTLEYAVLMTETGVVSDSDSWHKRRNAIRAAFDAAGLNSRVPFGAIIAYADIVGCYPVEDIKNLSDCERMFGDWSEGRYAWEIAHVRMVEPIPYKGQLGLWNVPYEIIQQLNTVEVEEDYNSCAGTGFEYRPDDKWNGIPF